MLASPTSLISVLVIIEHPNLYLEQQTIHVASMSGLQAVSWQN